MVGDIDAIRELLRVSKSGQPHVLAHFLYFPREGDARSAALELNRRGFKANAKPSGYDADWLVLAKHTIAVTEQSVGATRQLMESVARLGKGKYDGWEAGVRH